MMLPHIKYSDGIVKQVQSRFGGYNHSLYASDGDIYDMKNITSEHFPLVSQRNKRIEMPLPDIKLWKGTGFTFPDSNSILVPVNVDFSSCIQMGDKVQVFCYGDKKCSIDETLTVSGWKYNETDKTIKITFSDANFEVTTDNSSESILEIIVCEITRSVNNTTINYTKDDIITGFLGEIKAFGAGDKMYFVTGNGDFYYDGVYSGFFDKLSDVENIRFAETGAYIYILPSGNYFNKASGEIVKRFSETIHQNKSTPRFTITSNCIYLDDPGEEKINYDISIRDTVSVILMDWNGNTNSYSSTITEYKYNSNGKQTEIYFADNVFNGVIWGDIARLTITKSHPDLKCICATSNRIWGCDEETIYCTRFGHPDDWFYYPASDSGNIADSSWSITPFSEGGEFSGCIVDNGYPVFFKEDRIYKVYGDNASNFQLVESELPGVLKGSDKSLVSMENAIYYLSPKGVMRYANNSVANLTSEFFESFKDGVAGTDGDKYYISMKSKNGTKLFVFDEKKRLWAKEDDLEVLNFVRFQNELYSFGVDGKILKMNSRDNDLKYPLSESEGTFEEDIDSFIEFGDFYCQSPDKKGVSKLFLRLGVEDNSEVSIYINYDSEETEDKNRAWKSVKTISTTKKKSVILPIIPRRCDHFRIKIVAKGGFILYSMSYEYYNGSEI